MPQKRPDNCVTSQAGFYDLHELAQTMEVFSDAKRLGLGWKIWRIWSTDWWMNPHLALDRIHDRLAGDLKTERERKAAEEAARQAQVEAARLRDEAERAEAMVEIGEEEPFEPSTEHPDMDTGAIQNVLPFPRPVSPADMVEDEEAPARVYAGSAVAEVVDQVPEPASANAYREADLSTVAYPDQSRFYDPAYRRTIAAMADHVIEREDFVFKELVIARIRDAHGFQRARDQIRDIINKAMGDCFITTEEADGRIVLWPRTLSPQPTAPWRGLGTRSHIDVPIAELASLADYLNATGLDE